MKMYLKRCVLTRALLAKNIYALKDVSELMKESVLEWLDKDWQEDALSVCSNWDHLSFDIFHNNNGDRFRYFEETADFRKH